MTCSDAPVRVSAPIVRIYRPALSVTQSGRANTGRWVLEFEPVAAPEIDPLTGWTGSSDPLQQVRLTFPTKERAIAFAARQGWHCTVGEPRLPRMQRRIFGS